MSDHRRFIASYRLQYGDRVRQLLPRALEFREGSVGPAMCALAFETAQSPARIAHRLPRALQVVVHVAKLIRPRALIGRQRILPLSFKVRAFLGSEIGDVGRLGQQRAFRRRERLEAVSKVGAIFRFHGRQQLPQLVAQAALIVDDPVEARFEMAVLIDLIRQLLDSAQDNFEVDARILVPFRRQARRIAEPCRAGTQRLDGLLERFFG